MAGIATSPEMFSVTFNMRSAKAYASRTSATLGARNFVLLGEVG